jgi:hypothetical protein
MNVDEKRKHRSGAEGVNDLSMKKGPRQIARRVTRAPIGLRLGIASPLPPIHGRQAA